MTFTIILIDTDVNPSDQSNCHFAGCVMPDTNCLSNINADIVLARLRALFSRSYSENYGSHLKLDCVVRRARTHSKLASGGSNYLLIGPHRGISCSGM